MTRPTFYRRTIDLCEPKPGDVAAFCALIAERAEADHAAGRRRPTGLELCEEYAEGHRMGHRRLAASVYAKTRWSFEAAEHEREEAGL